MASGNYGTVLSLSGVGGITSAYQSGSSWFPCGASSFVKLKVTIATDPLSQMTGLTLKCQGLGTASGTDVCDLISYRLDTNVGQPELAHAYTGLAPNNTVSFLVEIKDCRGILGGFRVAAFGTFA